MSIVNIDGLPFATALNGAELLEVEQGGVNSQSSLSALATLLQQPLLPVPPQAAAAGYNVLTYGPKLILGSNFKNYNFGGVTPIAGQSVQQSDASVLLPITDGSNFGANIATANWDGSTWRGTAFTGGWYCEAVLKFTATLGSSSLPFPAHWALDTGYLTGNSAQWPGQAPGFIDRVELDIMQWPHNSALFYSGITALNWMGPPATQIFNLSSVAATGANNGTFTCASNPSLAVGTYVAVSGVAGGTGSIVGYSNPSYYKISAISGTTQFTLTTTGGGAITTTAGTITGLAFQGNILAQPTPDQGSEIKITQVSTQPPLVFSNYNRYGCLYIPATATTQGTLINYLNGQPVVYVGVHPAPTVVWNQYNSGAAPPLTIAGSGGAILDNQLMVFIFGTDTTCPMQIQSFSVWQSTPANAVVN